MADLKLDTVDRKILRHLQTDGRMTNADLAEAIHLSPSSCLRRVKRLEDEGFISGYVMLINPAAIGKPSSVFVEISLSNQSEETLNAFEKAAAKYPDVMECYLMAGEFDYLLRVEVADTADFERIHKTVLSRLPGIARIRSSFTLRTVCKRTTYDL